MEEKEIKYTIEYHKQLSELERKPIYILWKNITSKRGGNVIAIHKGSHKDCYEKLKEIKTSSK